MTNPLFNAGQLPAFSQIKTEHIQVAVEKAIADCKSVIDKALSQNDFTYQNLVVSLEVQNEVLHQVWSPVSHMFAVVNSDELREAYDVCLPLLSEYATYVGQHEGLCSAFKAIKADDSFGELTQAQQEVIEQALKSFKLSGIDLPDAKKQRYGEIQAALSKLGSEFGNNVMDANTGWTFEATHEYHLSGLPESIVAAAKAEAEAKSVEGWLFTLSAPSFIPVMTYADNEDMRREMYMAYNTRASDQGPNAGEWDNTALMNEMMALRHEIAQLLGFESYAYLSLATKMAETPEQVLAFLTDLASKSKAQGDEELAEIKTFAKKEFGLHDMQIWDVAYYAEKLKQAKYAFSDEELRPYFPENKVVPGLFEVVKRLFGLNIVAREDVDVWHKDVSFYDIFDENDQLRGSFYLDLYARDKKRGGAWMDNCINRMRMPSGEVTTPVAYLTCNFNKPVGDKPALFTHDEVVTLFHEFGHGIHHMLTQVEESSVSGINGVPWDAVELPSQFLENWCWQPEALSFISGHVDSGEPLPQAMLDKLLAAKDFQSAMQMLRQLEFAIFDFRIHGEYDSEKGIDIQATLNDVREQVSVFIPPADNRFQHAFGHIFSGGYSAGYYSYKWAEVLSADAFSKFESNGIFDKVTGREFLTCILEKGGSDDPMVLFESFMGRKPTIDALLRHSGIQ